MRFQQIYRYQAKFKTVDALTFFISFDLWSAIVRGRLNDTERTRYPWYLAISLITCIIPTAVYGSMADKDLGYFPVGSVYLASIHLVMGILLTTRADSFLYGRLPS